MPCNDNNKKGIKLKIYSAGEAAKFLNIPYYTLHNLEVTEKIPRAERTSSNQRYYTRDDLGKIKEILDKIVLHKRPGPVAQ